MADGTSKILLQIGTEVDTSNLSETIVSIVKKFEEMNLVLSSSQAKAVGSFEKAIQGIEGYRRAETEIKRLEDSTKGLVETSQKYLSIMKLVDQQKGFLARDLRTTQSVTGDFAVADME